MVGPADVCRAPNDEKSVHADPATSSTTSCQASLSFSVLFDRGSGSRPEHFEPCFLHLSPAMKPPGVSAIWPHYCYRVRLKPAGVGDGKISVHHRALHLRERLPSGFEGQQKGGMPDQPENARPECQTGRMPDRRMPDRLAFSKR